eukprot:Sspe_Gene.81975::Locus_53359_Transcript_1_1_Confidence_1.000_Length_465::g.81975::m.81975
MLSWVFLMGGSEGPTLPPPQPPLPSMVTLPALQIKQKDAPPSLSLILYYNRPQKMALLPLSPQERGWSYLPPSLPPILFFHELSPQCLLSQDDDSSPPPLRMDIFLSSFQSF